MRMVVGVPPNFEAIDAVFKVAGKPVIYAYGETIFNPQNIVIPPELLVHESVHGNRQGNDPAGWWKRYLVDPEFRVTEELPAHQAEFKAFCRRESHRGKREHALWQIAARLSGPLYGRAIKYSVAKRLVAQ